MIGAAKLEARFWAKAPARPDTTCWIWTGSLWPAGYGRVRRDGHQLQAHRVAFAYANGPIPEGMDVLHRCDNPPCVNADHLYLGTDADNVRDRMERGRSARQLGEACGTAKLTEALVREMRRQHAAGVGFRRLGRAFGVSKHAASLAVTGQTWGHVK